jgi:O-methyltransferase
MPTLEWNASTWDGAYDWGAQGEEWSKAWGGSEAQWFGCLYPRLHRFLPASSVLEIAPGFGRWTKFLIPNCNSLTGIDLSQECIDACNKIFSSASNTSFVKNDGLSLEGAPEQLDFVFSFDSLVHVEFDVLDGYIKQIIQKLSKTGVAFLHHSNFGALPVGAENPHQRARSVSATRVAQSVIENKGTVISQELVNWGAKELTDCFTILCAAGEGQTGLEFTTLRNYQFMLEAEIIRSAQAMYSGSKFRPNDLRSTELYLSVPPEHPVDPVNAAATVGDNMLSFYLDNLSPGLVSGWAFDLGKSESVPIEVRCGDSIVATGTTGLMRPDVAKAFPSHPAALRSGFNLTYPRDALYRFGAARISVSVWSGETKLGEHRIISTDVLQSMDDDSAPDTRRAYVPAFLRRATIRLSGSQEPSVEQIVNTIISLAESRSSHPAFLQYVRFMSSAWNHCRFVDKYFPTLNERAADLDKDRLCKQNSPVEMMSIIHHLYVLQSYGVSGAFAEFGSFKGYSSSMLSWACASLGIEMHIFDSFEGLPPSDSGYYRAGDFAGSLEEVRRNIELFGAAGNVVFHKGYFSESLRNSALPPLLSLWMDVDLESSSRDVMTIADKIDPAGAIFSHETSASDFDGLSVISRRGADAVIGPIVDRFAELGAELDGAFMAGNTGAFWRHSTGIPVLPHAALVRLLAAL